MKIYFAGPLFTEAEQMWNVEQSIKLTRAGHHVFLPQSQCSQLGNPSEIFRCDLDGLEESDVIVAVCDGADMDSGTAWECGYARGKSKPVLALRTDFRGFAREEKFNLMISKSSHGPFNNIEEVIEYLKEM